MMPKLLPHLADEAPRPEGFHVFAFPCKPHICGMPIFCKPLILKGGTGAATAKKSSADVLHLFSAYEPH